MGIKRRRRVEQQSQDVDTNMSDCRALVPTQPTTQIQEISSSAVIPTPPTTQSIQPIHELPKLDFLEAISSVPTNFQVDSLQVHCS
jgi:hypothetical protein